ncbi:hypothetical protein GPL15_20980 [Clostridium sp. MCC353]|uniref:hypothetical protein n=1 Tax=Clostridium sp. MCC353 TaxID=2592646 RepID=UPI001C027FB3|nr:hypothetical protein [Clostridium sp. MCC353]MBT9778954.1 hypothetical protein [Clostridium sp. MCC353]
MKGTITGGDYVGGIAGYAKTVEGNYGMTVIQRSEDGKKEDIPGEYHGSIVGEGDEEGTITANIYVDNGLGANDGITHRDEADGLAYGEFIQLSSIPAEFYRIQAVFLSDGEEIKTVNYQILWADKTAAAQAETVRMRVYTGNRSGYMSAAIIDETIDGPKLRILGTERKGEYLIFEAGTTERLILLQKERYPMQIVLVILGVVFSAAAGCFLVYRKKYL